MSYLVLARKYRPQTFEELVGQEHVTTTLVNALDAKRLAHAYIFSGPRGCGKTTTARILGKALNCEKGPTPKPCGKCSQCVEIASGNSPDDVLEIDGASNRGIDQIRELRDTVKYSPARSRYRIYIIDEAHQITEAGFNALLKTLEEPPAHAVFMMATTEAQKIPATILSRCQRFQLKSIPPLDIRAQLEKILKLEKISFEAEALLEVARAANGSLRDALSLLDQVIAYSPEGVNAKDIRALLGLLPQESVKRFAAVIREGSPEKVLQAIQQSLADGFDLFQLARDLTDYWHALFLVKSGVKSQTLLNLAENEKEAANYAIPQLERFLQITARCSEQMRRSESPRVTFELACLDLAKKAMSADELLGRLERLEKSIASGSPLDVKKKSEPAPERVSGGASAPSAVPLSEIMAATGPAPAVPPAPQKLSPAAAPSPARPSSVPSSQAQTGDNVAPLRPDQVRTAWAKMLEEVGPKKPSLEGFLLSSRWEVKAGNVLAILAAQPFHQQQITANQPLLRDALARNLAANFTLQCLVQEGPAPAAEAAPAEDAETTEIVETNEESEETSSGADETAEPPPPEPFSSAANELGESDDKVYELDPGVKKLMDKFPGKLKKIEPNPTLP